MSHLNLDHNIHIQIMNMTYEELKEIWEQVKALGGRVKATIKYSYLNQEEEWELIIENLYALLFNSNNSDLDWGRMLNGSYKYTACIYDINDDNFHSKSIEYIIIKGWLNKCTLCSIWIQWLDTMCANCISITQWKAIEEIIPLEIPTIFDSPKQISTKQLIDLDDNSNGNYWYWKKWLHKNARWVISPIRLMDDNHLRNSINKFVWKDWWTILLKEWEDRWYNISDLNPTPF